MELFKLGDMVPYIGEDWETGEPLFLTHMLRDEMELRIANGARALTLAQLNKMPEPEEQDDGR